MARKYMLQLLVLDEYLLHPERCILKFFNEHICMNVNKQCGIQYFYKLIREHYVM